MHRRDYRHATLRDGAGGLSLATVRNLVDYDHIRALILDCLDHRRVLILWVVDLQDTARADGRVRDVAGASNLEALVHDRDDAVALA